MANIHDDIKKALDAKVYCAHLLSPLYRTQIKAEHLDGNNKRGDLALVMRQIDQHGNVSAHWRVFVGKTDRKIANRWHARTGNRTVDYDDWCDCNYNTKLIETAVPDYALKGYMPPIPTLAKQVDPVLDPIALRERFYGTKPTSAGGFDLTTDLPPPPPPKGST